MLQNVRLRTVRTAADSLPMRADGLISKVSIGFLKPCPQGRTRPPRHI